MRVLVINLERAADRRRHMTGQFANVGVPCEFLTAIDGAQGDHPLFAHYDAKRCTRFYGKPLTPGAVGCYASHFTAWQRCVDSNEPLVVMEDDVVVLPAFPQALQVLGELLAEYPLIRLFGQRVRPLRRIRQVAGFELIRFLRGPAGGHGYAISPHAAAVLIAGSKWWREPVDRYIDRFWTHGLNSMALHPYPLGWMDGPSDTRIWESKSTPFTFVRKTVRVGEHVMRHLYNVRQGLRSRRQPRVAPPA